jgi:2-keto-3-deoxy-L-rhamnonate aldolase RhmA
MSFHAFHDLLNEGRPLLGSWCGFRSFSNAEAMATLGLDFLILETQHGEITLADFPALFGAFGRTPTVPVVRAPRNDYHAVNWLYDQGAPAVLVPMVNSPADARLAVEAAKFPPAGRRSFGPQRAGRYGTAVAEYMRASDERTTLIVQLEHYEAAERIGEILAIPGVDAVFMGPNDLALSMLEAGARPFDAASSDEGWAAMFRNERVDAMCARVLEACLGAGKPFGITSGSIEEAGRWFAAGARFVTLGNEFLFLQAGARAMTAGRVTLGN